jgi:mycofactocin system glycosyltransferase
MMSGQPPRGCFRLKSGIRLIETPEGGIVLQSSPLRALKINRSAWAMLDQCRSGLQIDGDQMGAGRPSAMALLDAFHQGGLLEWTPPPTSSPPSVSIIIPVFNRPAEIEACLASLQVLDYPAEKIEVIVVDDASWDHTAAVVRRFDVRLIVQPHNQGQSAARNAGVAAADGEIIAFLDSDCTAQPDWLRSLTPYFQDPRVALVGGYVDTCYREKAMDRYEQVCSALNMGREPVMGRGDRSVFYVPTCNMLVRRQAYLQVGGLDERLQVGEDVDLCWRLMAAKHHLLYRPEGAVRHKHRNRLLPGLLRRFDYGTSEAVLYARFPKVSKQFPWQPAGIGLLIAGLAALVSPSWYWLLLMAGLLAVETGCKQIQLKRKMGLRLPSLEILTAAIKGHFQLAYYLAFYLVRYHLLLLIVLSCALPALIWLWLALIMFPTLVAYFKKRPRLSFPVFAFFYLAEHAFYQSGAFWGCLKQMSFRLYGIGFRLAGFKPRPNRADEDSRLVVKKTRDEAAIGSP